MYMCLDSVHVISIIFIVIISGIQLIDKLFNIFKGAVCKLSIEFS